MLIGRPNMINKLVINQLDKILRRLYNRNLPKSMVMNVKQINNVNEALLILRHFIDLSAKLLPFLDELERKKYPTRAEMNSRNKIIEVYNNYSFDTSTSKTLLNSDVLDLIKETFDSIATKTISDRRKTRNSSLRMFLMEHRRLQENWYNVEAN